MARRRSPTLSTSKRSLLCLLPSCPARSCSPGSEARWCLGLVFFLFLYMGIFILSSLPLWACGCMLQAPVPVGAGTGREGWEEISTTIRQTTQGLSRVHKATALVKPNHSSKPGRETTFLQAPYGVSANCAPAPSPPKLPAPARMPHADGCLWLARGHTSWSPARAARLGLVVAAASLCELNLLGSEFCLCAAAQCPAPRGGLGASRPRQTYTGSVILK